jgi:hypothetical protein
MFGTYGLIENIEHESSVVGNGFNDLSVEHPASVIGHPVIQEVGVTE